MTTTTAPVLPRLIEIICTELTAHRLPHNVPEVTADSTFERDLMADWLDMACIIQAAEEAFCVDLPASVENCETVADLARLVEG